ncbi:DUF1289 domain-containing protein [Porticoccaceae bacterium]|nr:DUF1289 domain-containing protein [Porticoccaceae bacterium]MDA8682019.1 DUF1289 domain-containing protein [Porticoccaceae bacterium]MDB2634840.1 DUF1289 domain-containing protein [Porticoccaceae bacterium]
MTSDPVIASPCVAVCALTDDDICVGCYRTTSEIQDWRYLANAEKINVLRICNERRQEYRALP